MKKGMHSMQDGFRRAWKLALLAVALLASTFVGLCGLQAIAAEKDLSNKGEEIVRENCARCHAIGTTGESAVAEAPPFRTLSENYPVESLAESLAEGIVSGHPDMPIFVFKPHDVDAIIVYLESIQTPAVPKEAPAGARQP